MRSVRSGTLFGASSESCGGYAELLCDGAPARARLSELRGSSRGGRVDALGPSELHTFGANSSKARLRSVGESLAFLLCYPREHTEHKVPRGSRLVQPRFSHAHYAHTARLKLEHVSKIPVHRPPETIERPHNEHVELTAPSLLEQLRPHGPMLRSAPYFDSLTYEIPASRTNDGAALGELSVGVLLGGGHPGVDYGSHATSIHRLRSS